jgi:hypothetical protein
MSETVRLADNSKKRVINQLTSSSTCSVAKIKRIIEGEFVSTTDRYQAWKHVERKLGNAQASIHNLLQHCGGSLVFAYFPPDSLIQRDYEGDDLNYYNNCKLLVLSEKVEKHELTGKIDMKVLDEFCKNFQEARNSSCKPVRAEAVRAEAEVHVRAEAVRAEAVRAEAVRAEAVRVEAVRADPDVDVRSEANFDNELELNLEGIGELTGACDGDDVDINQIMQMLDKEDDGEPQLDFSIDDPRASVSVDDPRASVSVDDPRASVSVDDPRASVSVDDPRPPFDTELPDDWQSVFDELHRPLEPVSPSDPAIDPPSVSVDDPRASVSVDDPRPPFDTELPDDWQSVFDELHRPLEPVSPSDPAIDPPSVPVVDPPSVPVVDPPSVPVVDPPWIPFPPSVPVIDPPAPSFTLPDVYRPVPSSKSEIEILINLMFDANGDSLATKAIEKADWCKVEYRDELRAYAHNCDRDKNMRSGFVSFIRSGVWRELGLDDIKNFFNWIKFNIANKDRQTSFRGRMSAYHKGNAFPMLVRIFFFNALNHSNMESLNNEFVNRVLN